MDGDGMELGMAGDEALEKESWRPRSIGVMLWVFQELGGRAQEVVNHTFERLNMLDEKEREDYLIELEKSIVNIRLKDRKLYQAVEFNQYKVEGSEFRKLCADQAMRYAVAVLEELDRNVNTSRLYHEVAFFKQSAESFYLMINWLIEAQRHLAALDAFENVRKEVYAIRAAKGGHSRSRSASEKDQRKLLEVMIKGLVYADPKALSRAERNITAVVGEWAEEIYEINRNFPIFSWSGGLDKFRGEVLDILVQKLKRGEDISDRHMRIRLRFRGFLESDSKSSSDGSSCEDTELIREKGQQEGVQLALVYLLEQRFGVLPDAALVLVRSIISVDDLLACLDRLPKAPTWESTLVNEQLKT